MNQQYKGYTIVDVEGLKLLKEEVLNYHDKDIMNELINFRVVTADITNIKTRLFVLEYIETINKYHIEDVVLTLEKAITFINELTMVLL